MPIDPNIILQGMPQSFDTNALLQQQMQGLQNINVLERQRKADELAMQDRAAAAEKEAAAAQEAATLKALLPAYTYGIQTGDMVGAGNLVPPEIRPQLQPYIDALSGKSPQEVQAALIGSLSSSPMGQEALAAIQRGQTFGVQQGQLDVSRERLAFDKEKAAAEAASGGKVVQWITDDAGNVTGLDAQGNIVSTVPGIGKKTSATGPDGVKLKPGERITADGKVEAVPGSDLYTKQKANYTKDYKGATTVVDKIAEAQAKIDRITSEDNSSGFAGNFGGYNAAYATQYFPGQTQDVASDIESLKADLKNAGLELIRNGGSIGQITEREWPIIEQQLANLTPFLSEAKARDILANVAARLDNIAARAIETYDMQWGDTQFYTPITAKPVTTGAPRNSPPSAASGGQDTNGDGVVDFNDL